MSAINPTTAQDAPAVATPVNGLHFVGWPTEIATGPLEITPSEEPTETTGGGW